MTNEEVREVFSKHYSGDLNEAMMAASSEIFAVVATKYSESGQNLSDIIKTLARGKGLVYLFAGIGAGSQTHPVVPDVYLSYFDELRKLTINAVRYANDNYTAMQPLFRERFLPEHLRVVAEELTRLMEEPSRLPANTRGLNLDELNLENDMLTNVLIGILGVDGFQRFSEEYNLCLKVLRLCQSECHILETMLTDGKAS